MRIGHIELFVSDPLASKNFYQDVLGFEVTAEQGSYIWVKKGAIELLLRPGNAPKPATDYQNTAVALVFYTDDLAKTRAELAARGLKFKGTDGSPDCLTFTDPDGNWLQLVDPGTPHAS